ncbi:MAG: dTDP-4-amino-4,6-dideoxygalactose transaminase [Bacteroidales bacterium]
MNIPFNIPYISGQELFYIKTALQSKQCSSEGIFIDRVKEWFAINYKTPSVFLTTSCTDALEMAALICKIQAGDEVIIPSWTHVSTANAFALRGARIVFTDVEAGKMTLDVNDVISKISDKTKAIAAVHYGGYGADIIHLKKICDSKNIFLIEDAAHSIGAGIDGHKQGTIGHLGCISFHESKNIHCGEGGILLVNDKNLIETAEIVFQKGTNRSMFLRGEVPFYEWIQAGSSFSMSNLTAAMLLAQLQETDNVNYRRLELWKSYYELLGNIDGFAKYFSLPPLPDKEDDFNAHIFFIKGNSENISAKIHRALNNAGIQAQFHFPPLHTSLFGKRFSGNCPVTASENIRLLRLPLFYGMNSNQIKKMAIILGKILKKIRL